MKILQINKMYPPEVGGVETVVQQYSEMLLQGNNVTALVTSKDFQKKTQIDTINGVHVIRCSSLGSVFSMPFSFSFIIWYLKIRNRFDVIHTHEPFPLSTLLIALFPPQGRLIVTWHSDIVKQKYLKIVVEYFQKIVLKYAQIITVTSSAMLNRSHIVSRFKNKTTVLPLSIDSKRVQLLSGIGRFPDKIAGFDDGRDYYIYIGRISYYKGLQVLIDSYKDSSQKIPLVIIGAGDKKLEEYIRREDENELTNIYFINHFLSEEDKYYLLKKAYMLIFPSVFSSEAFGIIQLESMILGTPVINTNLPTGVPWVSVNEETGFTVEPNNKNQLTQILDKKIPKSEYDQLTMNAKKRVLDFFEDSIIKDKLVDIYEIVGKL